MLPPFWFCYVQLFVFYYTIYRLEIFQYWILWLIFSFFKGPLGGETEKMLLRKALFRKFEGFPISFSINTTAILLCRTLLLYPIESILYYIDEIIFSEYKKVEIKRPVFLFGQPRSGTTKAESIITKDPNLIGMKLYEVRFPYLCLLYFIDAIDKFDQKFLFNSLYKIAEKYKLFHFLDESDPNRHKMRKIRLNLEDEDELMFLFQFLYHAELISIFPDWDIAKVLIDTKYISKKELNKMMNFYHQSVQKFMYRRGGKDKRYFSKMPSCWVGYHLSLKKMYPDAQYIMIVRKAQDQVPSRLKLLHLVAINLTNQSYIQDSVELREELIKGTIQWYQNQIDFVEKLQKKDIYIIKFEDFYQDVYESVRKIYQHLDMRIESGGKFEKALLFEREEQKNHKPTPLDESFVKKSFILQNFPDLQAILLKKME